MTDYTNRCGIPYCNCTGACFSKLAPNTTDLVYPFNISSHLVPVEQPSLREEIELLKSKIESLCDLIKELKE